MSYEFNPVNFRLSREVSSINKALSEYQGENGQVVSWFEYDAVTSTEAPVYGEGPSRRWLPGKPVRCLFAMYYESDISPDVDDEGLYTIDRMHLTLSADQMRRDGISNPLSPDEHLRDRIIYENQTYTVQKFRLRGRSADTYMVVTVDLEQVKVDDTELDDTLSGKEWSNVGTTTWGSYITNNTTWGSLHGV